MFSRSARLLAVAVAALAVSDSLHSQPAAFDLVIRNGRIVDGTGNPWFMADIGITGDTSEQDEACALAGIAAAGLVADPGAAA